MVFFVCFLTVNFWFFGVYNVMHCNKYLFENFVNIFYFYVFWEFYETVINKA